MTENQPLPLSIQPVISYPREAQAGKTYMMTIDLQTTGGEWLYEAEEYAIDCMLDTSPLFSYKTLGESSVVLHRFGGTYGAAKFLLTAVQEEMEGEIKVTLVNNWGVPIRVLNLINVHILTLNLNVQPLTRIRDIVKKALAIGYLSVEAENQLRHLLTTRYDLEDFNAFMTLQEAAMNGRVKQHSRQLGLNLPRLNK